MNISLVDHIDLALEPNQEISVKFQIKIALTDGRPFLEEALQDIQNVIEDYAKLEVIDCQAEYVKS